VATPALDPAVAGTIALWTGVVEASAKSAQKLEILQALNSFLCYCLSTVMENATARHEQLPEWQKKSLTWLPDPFTADNVPNSKKMNAKRAIPKVVEERDVRKKCFFADFPLIFLDSRRVCRA
jgi:hypothetical protein